METFIASLVFSCIAAVYSDVVTSDWIYLIVRFR